MLDPSGNPTPRAVAAAEREVLLERLGFLKVLELWLKQNAGNDTREQTRADAVTIANEYLRRAIDALELASQE